MNRRTVLVTGAVVVLAAAATLATIGLGGRNPGRPAPGVGRPLTIAAVTRTTLTQTQDVNGTLGYGPQTPVEAAGDGTITWLPAPGAVIRRGQPVYRRDDAPVPLLLGGLPLYRDLRPGVTGDDVREVEENLSALGYTGFGVDTAYTAATAGAVRRWQRDLGVTQTGVVTVGAAVLAPAPVRVASVAARLGGRASGALLGYTGTTRTVRVALDVTLQALVRRGTAATVTLPDGRAVRGTVAAVGSVAVAGAQPADPATVEVAVAVADQAALGTFSEAPVTVRLVAAMVRDVLTVPVAALTVLPDGRYGVQVVTGSTSHVVPVELGLFADGRVEVSGAGLSEGMQVGVPRDRP